MQIPIKFPIPKPWAIFPKSGEKTRVVSEGEQQDGKEGIAGFTLPHPVQKLMSLAEVVSPKKEKGIVGFQLPHPVQELMSLAEVGSPTKEKGIAGFQLPHPVQKLISPAEVGSLKKEKNTELESLFATQLSVKPKVLKNALQGNLELADSLPDPPVSKNNKNPSVNTKPGPGISVVTKVQKDVTRLDKEDREYHEKRRYESDTTHHSVRHKERRERRSRDRGERRGSKKGVITLVTEAIPQEGRIGLRPEDVRKRKSITGGEVVRMIAHQKRTGEGRPVKDVDKGRETMIVIGITQDVALIIGVATNAGPSFITRTVTQTLRESIGHAGEEKKRGVIQRNSLRT
ncbi:hypothetical protein DPMN_178773 [Dreissena polymorpha]|uniref:Uncharacterized protein n=1 Tax=Dreissena polymorpha TaxID=45954 RepID=A0A9D4IMX6_DREPO|nr:hypothetical protein DPMN_178773 [Dreissena polymorpha]